MTLLAALIGFACGVAATSAPPPRTALNTFGPLFVGVALVAVLEVYR